MADGSSNTLGGLVLGTVALALVGAGTMWFGGARDPAPAGAPASTASTVTAANATPGPGPVSPAPGIARTGFTPPGYTPGPAAPAPPATAPGLITTGTPQPVEIPAPEPGQEPVIAFNATLHDFGTVMQGANPVARFRFHNTGTGPLQIVRLHSHCSCAPAMTGAQIIPPGGYGEIRVTFQTAALAGVVSKTVEVTSNDPAHPQVVLTVSADVRREYRMTPDAFSFGQLAPGASASQTVEVTHGAGRPFRIVEVWGAPASCRVRVEAAETLGEGGRADRWRVVFDVPKQTRAMTVAGRILLRTEPATPTPLWIPFSLRVQPSIELDPWQVNFGVLAHDARPEAFVLMRALGDAPFTVLEVKVSPPGQIVVTHEAAGNGRRFRIVPGPRWPSSGRVQASVRVTTDHLQIPAVIPVYAAVMPNEK